MQKVLVTGATGFIGNYVVIELLKRNIAVVATSVNEDKAKSFTWYNAVDYIPFDLKAFTGKQNLFNLFCQPTHLIHLAWEGLPNYTQPFHIEENLPRHYKFLAMLVEQGLQDITVAGTCLEYGLKEGVLKETDTVAPTTPYAKAKNELRKMLEALELQYPFALKWVRLFFMYGKGQSSQSLLSQLEQALANGEDSFNMSGGEQQRDYLPVEEVAENIVSIALQDKVKGIINCSSGQAVKLKDFVQDYLNKKNKSIHLNLGHYPYTTYEAMSFWGDNTKLMSIVENES